MREVIDCLELYNTNADFKEYVDKFMICHRHRGASLEEVLSYKLVKLQAKYYIDLKKEK